MLSNRVRSISSVVLVALLGCGSDDTPEPSTAGPASTFPPATRGSGGEGGSGNSNEPSPEDTTSDAPEDDSGGVECTFPDHVSVCGCGNACVGAGVDYGFCETCGPEGSGCSRDDIWCCADDECPSGTQCSTLSSSASFGYHICIELEPCLSDADCFDEPCEEGFCRDGF